MINYITKDNEKYKNNVIKKIKMFFLRRRKLSVHLIFWGGPSSGPWQTRMKPSNGHQIPSLQGNKNILNHFLKIIFLKT